MKFSQAAMRAVVAAIERSAKEKRAKGNDASKAIAQEMSAFSAVLERAAGGDLWSAATGASYLRRLADALAAALAEHDREQAEKRCGTCDHTEPHDVGPGKYYCQRAGCRCECDTRKKPK